jgi:hypothetical protein
MSITITDDNAAAAATWDTGATAKPGPAMTVHPERTVTDDQLSEVAADAGLNSPFLADLLASCATHERCGVNLFTSLAARTDNPAAKHRFEQFRDDAFAAVVAYDQLLEHTGVPAHYASPAARMTEAMDTRLLSAFLLTGAADQMTIELKGVEAVLLASTMCVANSALMRSVAESMEEGPSRTAVEETLAKVEPAQQEHLEWAANMQQQLVMAQVSSSAAQKVGAAAEAVVGKVRDVIGR